MKENQDGRNQMLIFDLDGTLYSGDDPYRFYAQEVSLTMNSQTAHHYLQTVEDHLNGIQESLVSGDNWEAVVRLAQPYLTDDLRIQAAFLATRQYMLSTACHLEIPPGLQEHLKKWREKAYLTVATNSPESASFPLLDKLGLSSFFDLIRADTHKPEGLLDLVQVHPLGKELPVQHIISVGDNYTNDIVPALHAGWKTVHLSPRGHFPGPATLQVKNLESAFQVIDQWLAGGTQQEDEGRSIS